MAEIWERQPGEPNLWWQRFQCYRDAGPSRSLLGCYDDERALKGTQKHFSQPPGSWKRAYQTWNWKSRAEAWDEEQARQRQRNDMETREEWRSRRKKLLQGAFNKLVNAVNELDPSRFINVHCPECGKQYRVDIGPSLGEVGKVLKTINDELRQEFGGGDADRDQGTGPRVVIYIPDNGRGDGDSPAERRMSDG